MKTNLFRKFKWYIVGFIMIVIMLSVGLSFCSWDDLSITKVLSPGKTGNYGETKWNNVIKDANGDNLTSRPQVGNIVQYGRYWQDTEAQGDNMLESLRWIIVDIDNNNIATLLAEKIVVYGNFWGVCQEFSTYYQNYYQSTLRAWLNSGRDSVTYNGTSWDLGAVAAKEGDENWRDDGIGSSFSVTSTMQANRGFLDVAFNSIEQTVLVPKHISEIQGLDKNASVYEAKPYLTRNGNDSISDFVWVPSMKEIFGDVKFFDNNIPDGKPYKQFEYFEKASVYVGEKFNTIPIAKASATDYAWNSYNTISSYYNNGKGGRDGTQAETWWWLRSPSANCERMLLVNIGGECNDAIACFAGGGVRPAVCVQL